MKGYTVRYYFAVVGSMEIPKGYEEIVSSLVELGINTAISELGIDPNDDDIAVVSGLTNEGISRISYNIAGQRGYATAGVACKQANSDKQSWPDVDEIYIVGELPGEEIPKVVALCHGLICISGDDQSHKVVSMFTAAGRLVVQFGYKSAVG